ncbi:MAG: phage tail protein, partial [Lacticaseibacillus paracasei]|nr:phage tail protein [Lacticaseibacillus paracasei]
MSTDIELYPRDQTDFSHHGYALDDISNDIVTWQLNAKFTLTFDYPMFSEHAGDLVAENIVRVPVPGGKAAFRIAQVIKSMGHLSITAYHVFWDLNDDFIADTNIVDKDGQGALDQIMRAANYPTGFKVLSTIGNVTNARLVRMSIIKALLGTDDNSFLNRWGGEFDWQDFSFSVNPRLGKDRGVHFEYAHNLTGYEATKDSSGIITRLLPEGYNGLLLPELYVDSPKLGNYRKPKIGTKNYQDIKAIDETQATGNQEGAVPVQEAYELLRAAAAKEFSESHIDEARWTYKLNVALLENTEEYKDLSITTTVLPGDTVTITHKLDGIDVRARLTGYTWQPSNHSYLTQTYDSTSRPDVAYSNLSSRVNEIKSQIELVDKVVIAKATNGMNSTGWGDQSPVDLNIAGKTGDVYYQTTAKGTIMWLFHDGQWNAETGDAFGTEVQKKVDTAIADVAAAKQAANDAVEKANSSAQLASMSNQTAQAAQSAADTANEMASKAVSAASDAATALGTANSALDSAKKAIDATKEQATSIAKLTTTTDTLTG